MDNDFDLAMPFLLVTICSIALTLTKIAIQIESENSSSLVVFRQGSTSIIAQSNQDNPPSRRYMMLTNRLPNSTPTYSIIRETHRVLIFWDYWKVHIRCHLPGMWVQLITIFRGGYLILVNPQVLFYLYFCINNEGNMLSLADSDVVCSKAFLSIPN